MDAILEAVKGQLSDQLVYYKPRLQTAWYDWQKAKANTLVAKFKSENMKKLFNDFLDQMKNDYISKVGDPFGRATELFGQETLWINLIRYLNGNQWAYDERAKVDFKSMLVDCITIGNPRYMDGFNYRVVNINSSTGREDFLDFLAPYGPKLYDAVKNYWDAQMAYSRAVENETSRENDVAKVRLEIDNLKNQYSSYIAQYGEQLQFKSSDDLLNEIQNTPEAKTVEAIAPTIVPEAPKSSKAGIVIAALAVGAAMLMGDKK